MNHTQYIRNRQMLERVEVVGPMKKSHEVRNAFHDDGWDCKHSGTRVHNGRIYGSQFLLVMEREIEVRQDAEKP